MRTTIDLPDELLRRVKASAAIRGMTLKDLVAQMLESGLEAQEPEVAMTPSRRRKLPIMIPAAGRKIPLMSNAELFQLIEREGDERHDGRS